MDFCHREGRISSSSEMRQVISIPFLTAAELQPNSGHKRRLSRLQGSSPAYRLSLRVPFVLSQYLAPRHRNANWPHMKEHTQPEGSLGSRVSSSPHFLPVPSSTFPEVPVEQLVSSQIHPLSRVVVLCLPG